MINTIGKKIHTLVKENTPRRHKIRPQCGCTQKATFFYIPLCFLPHCCANIGREVRLMLPNAYQEIYDTHTCITRVRPLQELRSFRLRPGWWSFAVKLMTPKKKLSTQRELRFVGQALNSFVWRNIFWSRRLKDTEEFSVSAL